MEVEWAAPPRDGEMPIALVTGAARRIGLAIARTLACYGYAVVLHTSRRSASAGREAAQVLAQEGRRAGSLVADLADAGSCEAIVPAISRAAGRLDLLVNNASVFLEDTAFAPDPHAWDRHFAVNVRAPAVLSAGFVGLAPRGPRSIVNILDQRVLRPSPQLFSYTLSKQALWTATRTMAQAFAPAEVRVNGVGPGPVLPNDSQGAAGFAHEVAGVPLARAVDPDEIAAAVLFLAGARSVTGQMIAVDAGQHLGWRTPDVVENV